MPNSQFDDIRPYYDSEIPAAMERISKSEYFPLLAKYIYPDKDINDVRELITSFRCIRDFQLEVMKTVNERVIANSITDFSYSGIENLSPDKKYLFVSNHRDIVLDSCLMQYILFKNGHETSEITFGSNLMMNQLIVDIGRSNKMFRVERGTSLRELYKISKHLSEYIRYAITQKNESVWIAQRNGRTKDGNDATDQGIINMFMMSKSKDKIESLAELNIVPVSISYEFEPCDIYKAVEVYISKRERYIKMAGEDLNSILSGIVQPKGRLNIHFGDLVTKEDLVAINEGCNADFHKCVANLLDDRIIGGYKLMPTNYVAYDILNNTNRYSEYYTSEDKNRFISGIDRLKSVERLQGYQNPDFDELNRIYLGIYANPVANKC